MQKLKRLSLPTHHHKHLTSLHLNSPPLDWPHLSRTPSSLGSLYADDSDPSQISHKTPSRAPQTTLDEPPIQNTEENLNGLPQEDPSYWQSSLAKRARPPQYYSTRSGSPQSLLDSGPSSMEHTAYRSSPISVLMPSSRLRTSHKCRSR